VVSARVDRRGVASGYRPREGLLDELAPLGARQGTPIPLKEIRVLDRDVLQLVHRQSRFQVAIDQRSDQE